MGLHAYPGWLTLICWRLNWAQTLQSGRNFSSGAERGVGFPMGNGVGSSAGIRWANSTQLTSYHKEGGLPNWLSGERIHLPMQEPQETRVKSLGREDSSEEEMATHSSILAWRIPWTAEPDGLQSIGWKRVGHDWSDLARRHASILAWKIPWTEEPGGLQSMGSQGVGHAWAHSQYKKGAKAGEMQALPNGAGLKALQMFSRLQRLKREKQKETGVAWPCQYT